MGYETIYYATLTNAEVGNRLKNLKNFLYAHTATKYLRLGPSRFVKWYATEPYIHLFAIFTFYLISNCFKNIFSP